MTLRYPSQFARDQIGARCEQALQRADATDIWPTPLEQVVATADVDEIIDLSALPDNRVPATPGFLGRLLGATIYSTRTVFVDLSQSAGRRHWTMGHEAVHALLPWHEASARLDDVHRLFRDSREELEIEANYGAGYLIFQGSRWMDKALDYRQSLEVPIGLAADAGASIHAAIRYYVENHPDPMALLVTGRIQRQNGRVPVYIRAESATWADVFPAADLIGGPELDISTEPLHSLVRQARLIGSVTQEHLQFDTLSPSHLEVETPVTIEVFDNQYNLFFLIQPKRRLHLGRRISTRVLTA